MHKFITLTSDFGVQSQSVGVMEATAFSISPESKVIHLMHGLPSFEIIPAARTLECVRTIAVGIHVCICDPGVGTSRKGIICETRRGDYLIGPDNGVLLPACKLLGGVVSVFEITNTKYMRQPVSPIFHGRDVFVPAAAFLAEGVPAKEFGPELTLNTLIKAPYTEAFQVSNQLHATVIHINKYGSLHLNILDEFWDSLGIEEGKILELELPNRKQIKIPFVGTFGDVSLGAPMILKDDYGRLEVAMNLSAFTDFHPVKIGSDVILHLV